MPEDLNEVLTDTKSREVAVLDALKEVRQRCGVDLGVAKRALAEHPAWHDSRQGLRMWGDVVQSDLFVVEEPDAEPVEDSLNAALEDLVRADPKTSS